MNTSVKNALVANYLVNFVLYFCFFYPTVWSLDTQSHHILDKSVVLSLFVLGVVSKPLGALIFGPISDIYGRKTVSVVSLLLCFIATIGMCVFSLNLGIYQIIAAAICRFLQAAALGGQAYSSLVHVHELVPKETKGKYSNYITGCNFFGVFAALGVAHLVQEKWYLPLLILPFIVGGALYFLKNTPNVLHQEKKASRKRIIIDNAFVLSVICQGLPMYVFYKLAIFRNDLTTEFSNELVAIYFTFIVAVFIPIFGVLSDKKMKKEIFLTGAISSAALLVFCEYFTFLLNPYMKLLFLTLLAVFTSMHISILMFILPGVFSSSKATNLASSSELSSILFSSVLPLLGIYLAVNNHLINFMVVALTLIAIPSIKKKLNDQCLL